MRCGVWTEAAKWLTKFDETVLTVMDANGYPVSVRVDAGNYDAMTGRLHATVPDALRPVEGPSNLLSHFHDEKLWKLNAIQIKGRIEKSDGAWVFQSTRFDAPPNLAFVRFLSNAGTAAQKYLDKRGLQRPPINWPAVKQVQRRGAAKR